MKTGRVVLRVELVVTKMKAALLLACAAVPFMSSDLASESTPLSVFYPVQYGSNNSVSSNYFVAGSTAAATFSIGNIASVPVGGTSVTNVPGLQVVAKDFGNAELVISNGVNEAISGKSAIRIRTKAAGVAQPLAFFPDTASYQLYLKDFCTWRYNTPCAQYETSIMVTTEGGLSPEGYWTHTSSETLADRSQLCCRMTTEQPPI